MSKTLKTPKDKWGWMPHPAHFMCSDRCQFHLATKVGRYIVSTVGEYWPERSVRDVHASIHDPKWHAENKHRKGDDYDRVYMMRFGFEDIGFDRKYETMVFKAEKMPPEGCKACTYKINVQKDSAFEGYNDAESARRGHMKYCLEFAKK